MCAKRRLPDFRSEPAKIPARQAPAESERPGESRDRSAESIASAERGAAARENGFSPRPAPDAPAHEETRQGRRDAPSAAARSDGAVRVPDEGSSVQRLPRGNESRFAQRAAGGKVRVGFLVHALELGGTERWLISLLEHCDQSRIEWTGVGFVNQARFDPSIVAEVERHVPVFRGPTAARQVVASSDVLICHFIPNLSSFTAGFPGRTILVSHLTGDWNKRLLSAAALGAKEFVAVSKAAAASFPPGRPVTVLHNGVDEKRVLAMRSRDEIRQEWGLAPHHVAVGFVGRFAPEKRPHLMAQAVARLGSSYRAIFVGGGPAAKEVTDKILSAAPDSIVRPPIVQIGDVLNALDCFVLPSLVEGFSLGLAEAWLAGVPTVATSVGAVGELEAVHGRLTIPLRCEPSADEVAAAIQAALSRDTAAIIAHARSVISSHYTAQIMANRWTSYLADSKSSPPHRYAPPADCVAACSIVRSKKEDRPHAPRAPLEFAAGGGIHLRSEADTTPFGEESCRKIGDSLQPKDASEFARARQSAPLTSETAHAIWLNKTSSDKAADKSQPTQECAEQLCSSVDQISPIRRRPRVSIIVAARNYAEFLTECLASCLAQTEPSLEVIYIDDASTDDSLTVARSVAGVRVVACSEHIGVVAARNRGARESTGDVLIFLDGDDLLTPTFVAAKLDALTQDYSFAYGHIQDFGERSGFLPAPEYAGYSALLANNFCESASAIWRRVFDSAGGYQPVPDNTLDDWHLWLRAARIAPPVKSESVLLYRVHSRSKSRTIGFAKPGANQATTIQRLRELFQPGGACYQPPLRVGFVFPQLHLGGAQQWLISLLQHLPSAAYIACSGVALTRTDLQCNRWIEKAAEHAAIYAAGVSHPRIANLATLREAVQAVAENSDVLVCWCDERLDELLEHFTGPVVLVSHGSSEWAERMMAVNKARATHLVACSAAAAGAFGVEAKVTVLHNGAEPDCCRVTTDREATRSRWGVAEGEIVVGHVGRLMWDKNPLAVANAVAMLGAPYRAVFVGSGIRQWDVQEAIRHAVSDPIFPGEASNIGDVLAAIDCLVLASPHEGFSLSLLEAWMAGVPTVATRVGAIPELEAAYGPMVTPLPIRPTPAQLADAVREALHPENSDRVERAKNVAMKHFTAKAMARRWADYMVEISQCWNHKDKL